MSGKGFALTVSHDWSYDPTSPIHNRDISMSRFNLLQELDEWRQKEELSPAACAATPESLPSENTAPKFSDHTPWSAMLMDSMSPMPRGSFILRFRQLVSFLKWGAIAIAVFIVWSLLVPFAAEIATWIGSNIVSLGVAILAIAIAGYLLVIYCQVYEGLPQDIFTLQAAVIRWLGTIGASAHMSSSSSEQTSGMFTLITGRSYCAVRGIHHYYPRGA